MSNNYKAINSDDGESETHPLISARKAAKAKARRALTAALVFTTVFMVGEVVGGYLANSLAIMTDAAHLLTDIGAMCLSLFAMWLSGQSPTSQMSFGFHRAEILGALASVLTIWALTGILVYEGILRILHPPEHVDGKIMFIVASGGLVVNILDAIILHNGAGGHGHGHSHGHSHGPSKPKKSNNQKESHEHEEHDHSHGGHSHGHGEKKEKKEKKEHKEHEHSHEHKEHKHKHLQSQEITDVTEVLASGQPLEKTKVKKQHGDEQKNINVYAAFIHVIGDCVQSLGVMGASALIWWRPEYKMADPITTFVFSAIVLFTTVQLLRQSLAVLMEGVPQGVEIADVQKDLEAVPHVAAIHDLHIWSITVGQPALSVHLILQDDADPNLSTDDILAAANRILRDDHGITHTTIQIERTTHRSECDNMSFHSSNT